jgi:hypothetical protein
MANILISCKFCGKKLMERQEDGLWHFVFGRIKDRNGQFTGDAPVDMFIHGNIKIKCIRRTCRKENILNFWPFSQKEIDELSKTHYNPNIGNNQK